MNYCRRGPMNSAIFTRRFASVACTKPPLQFKPQINRWKPAPEHAAALSALSNEFKSKLVLRHDQQKLSSELSYGISKSDLEKLELNEDKTLRELVSLKYADQSEINNFNKHQAIQFFSRGTNDTGSPEVQAGILTVRLNYLMKHAEKHKHDYSSKRLIVELLHDRKKHLKYLRRLSLARYFELLDKLGLPHDYLESFDNPYLYRYRTKFHKK